MNVGNAMQVRRVDRCEQKKNHSHSLTTQSRTLRIWTATVRTTQCGQIQTLGRGSEPNRENFYIPKNGNHINSIVRNWPSNKSHLLMLPVQRQQ